MTRTPDDAVAAFFQNERSADEAMADLNGSGFSDDQIHLFTVEGRDTPGNTLPEVAPAGGIQIAGSLGEMGGGIPVNIGSGGMAALAVLNLPEERTQHFHRKISTGRPAIVVHAGERSAIARTILERNGGEIEPLQLAGE